MSGGRLLIGLGNELRGDDVAGLLVARAARGREHGGIEIVEAGGEPVDLLAAWEGAGAAVVADAVASGAEPGAVHRLDAAARPLPAAFAAPSTHALGLAEAVELGRALGRLPPRLTVFGIEGTAFAAGAEPTPAVLAAVAAVAAAAVAELGGGGGRRPPGPGRPAARPAGGAPARATLRSRVDPSAGGVG